MNLHYKHAIRIGKFDLELSTMQHSWAKPRPWRGLTMTARFNSNWFEVVLWPPGDLIMPRPGEPSREVSERTRFPRLGFWLVLFNHTRFDTRGV